MVPSYRQRSWHGLSWREQRQVLRAARRGEAHHNDAIADAARRWAAEVLEPGRAWKGLVAGAVVSLLSGEAGGGWLGMLVAERRSTRRILRARRRASRFEVSEDLSPKLGC